MNSKRHPDYIKLRNRINECTKLKHIENLRQVVVQTNKLFKGTKWEEDGTDLLILFLSKEAEIEAEIDVRFDRLAERRLHAKKS